MDSLVKSKFRTNISSLQFESKYIRKEETKHNDIYNKESLRYHRIVHLRTQLRVTNLAYAYARGVPYKAVERTVKNPIGMVGVAMIVEKLKRKGLRRTTLEDVRNWLEE